MELNYKTLAIGVLVLLGAGYGIGRYLQPAEVKTEIKIVEKEVVVEKKDVVTVIKETKNSDGTITKETVITDRTTIEAETNKTTEAIKEVIAQKPQYRIRLESGYDFNQKQQQHALGLEKRFWGPLSLGVAGTVDQNMGFKSANLTVSWEF